MTQSEQLLNALLKKYEAQRAEGLAILNLYINQSVGVGEHPDILKEMDKSLNLISDADGKIATLVNLMPKENKNATK